METVTAEHAIKILNEALERDPQAITKLVVDHQACNRDLADHPTIQVLQKGRRYSVGMLGVINGIFGIDSKGWGFITAKLDDTGYVVAFEMTDHAERMGDT